MKKMVIFIIGIMMMAMLTSFFNPSESNTVTPKRKLAYEIINSFSSSLSKIYGLEYVGVSEEANDGKYKKIGLMFDYNNILSRDEARLLLLECSEVVLKAFNSTPSFKKHMENIPFTRNNISIDIFIKPESSENVEIYHPNYSVVSLCGDKLEYFTIKEENPLKYHAIEEESYAEALQLARLKN